MRYLWRYTPSREALLILALFPCLNVKFCRRGKWMFYDGKLVAIQEPSEKWLVATEGEVKKDKTS